MTTLLFIIFSVLGLIIGSFLNVVIARYGTQRTFGGRSACMSCTKELSPRELVPLFSFLWQKGRCLGCSNKISWQYPIVEFITALIFGGLLLKFEDIFYANTLIFSITYAYYAAMFSLLLVIAVYDLKHKIIPDMLSLFFGVLAFIGIFFFTPFGFHPHIPGVYEFLSGVFISLPFALLWLVSKGTWMGLGDAKLAIGLGWLLGFSRALVGVVVAFWAGAIVGIIMISILSKRYGVKSEIPLAPFLAFGALLAFMFEMHIFPFGF